MVVTNKFRITTENENLNGGFVVETDIDYSTLANNHERYPEWLKICFDRGYDLEHCRVEIIRVEEWDEDAGEWVRVFDPWAGIWGRDEMLR